MTGDAAWDRMLEFRYRSSERFEQALCAHIKSSNPRATVNDVHEVIVIRY